MKGLLRKDMYALVSVGWLFILMVLFFAVLPDLRFYAFTSVYSVMLLLSLLQIDEQYKWDTLLPMLPVSIRQVVLEKYIFCWGYVVCTAAFALGGQLIWSHIAGYMAIGAEYITILCFDVSLALFMQALVLPIFFRFGTTNGRLIMVVLVAVVTALSVSIISRGYEFILPLLADLKGWHLLIAGAALSGLSIPLSVKMYGFKLKK